MAKHRLRVHASYSRIGLLNWIGNNPATAPYNEARLVAEVPIKASTLGRIKSGSYVPSPRLANALMAVMERK